MNNKIYRDVLDNAIQRLAKLEAKVYAYEKIIANSNFAPIMREISEEK